MSVAGKTLNIWHLIKIVDGHYNEGMTYVLIGFLNYLQGSSSAEIKEWKVANLKAKLSTVAAFNEGFDSTK